jgi:hypothetical protein
MRPRHRIFARRWVTPMIILIIGGGLTYWASRAELARSEDIRHMVEDLCLTASRGEDLTHRLPTSNGAINRPLNDLLRACTEPLAGQLDRLQVVVTPGPEPGLGEKQTQFNATIRIDGHDRLTLQVTREDDFFIITGYTDAVMIME